jgi:hypothetical protein
MEDPTKNRHSMTCPTTTTTTTWTTAWTSNTATLSQLPETMLVPSPVDHHHHHKGNTTSLASFTNTTNGTDMIDDFMDGMYHPPPDKNDTNEANSSLSTKKKTTKKSYTKTTIIPNCAGHGQPCRLCTVKKSGPNQGRQFYVCATMSRMDQCPTFIWVDDTTKVRTLVLDSLFVCVCMYVCMYVCNIR